MCLGAYLYFIDSILYGNIKKHHIPPLLWMIDTKSVNFEFFKEIQFFIISACI